MDKLFESETGRKVLVNMCKEKAGDFAEECLSKLGGGGGGEGAESQEDKGFDVGDILQMVGGKKEDKKGFDVGDVLQMAGGKKEDKKGFDVTDVLSMAGGKQEDSGAGIGKALSGLFD